MVKQKGRGGGVGVGLLFVTLCLHLWMMGPFQNGPSLNPFALRKAKIVYNFGLSECNGVKGEKLLFEKQILYF